MPSPETLERFIARVEENAHAEAIEAFYTENASMQENQAAPRSGRGSLVQGERKVLEKAKPLTTDIDLRADRLRATAGSHPHSWAA